MTIASTLTRAGVYLLETIRLDWSRRSNQSRFRPGLAACVFFLSACMHAQTAHFSGAINTVGSGFSAPQGLAVDHNGDVFVADTTNNAVYEIVAVNGIVSSTSTVNTIGNGFVDPWGVAVDASGDVFVADTGNSVVKEIVAVGGVVSSTSTVNTVSGAFSNLVGIAVDASGDVFVASSAVYEIVAVNGIVSSTSTVNTVGSGFAQPFGVAVDASGDVFVADNGNSAVYEVLAVNGVVSSSSTVNQVGGFFADPYGVAVDAFGDVFVADPSYSNAVQEIVAVNGVVSSSSLVESVGSGFANLEGVAIDGHGNLFVGDTFHSRVAELRLNGINFNSLPVATVTPTTLSFAFTFDTSGTIDVPAVLTQGAAGLDFIDAGSGTCTTNGTSYAYNTGDACTVDVTFTPTASGVRYGAVTLSNSSAAPIATGYIDGTGIGPQVAFSPGSQSAFAGAFLHPNRMAVDAAGNLFVAVAGNVSVGSFVQEVLASGGYTTVNSLGSGYSYPAGLALDGAGNVFVADTYNQAIKEIVAAGGYTTINTIGSGFSFPDDVAVDANGNVFVADTGNSAVKEILATGGYTTVITLGSGFSAPRAVALDASGNLFVADTGNNAVKELLAASGYTTINTINPPGGFHEPSDLTLDGNGNLYVLNVQYGFVEEVFASGGYTTTSYVPLSVPAPVGVAVDAKGNLFVSDNQNSQIDELDVSDPPAFHFATMAVDANSDSPQYVQIVNNGNAALTIEVPSSGMNPSASSGFTNLSGGPTCPELSSASTAATLAVGASCYLFVSFTPTVPGSITGSLVLTDDALNAPGPSYATQTFLLSGTATAVPLTASTSVVSMTLTQGHAATAFTPVTASGGTGTLTYSVAPALPGGMYFSSSTGIVSGTPTALSPATTYTVTVTDTNSATATATFGLTVNSAVSATASLASTGLTLGHAASGFTPVTASGGTGTLTYSIAPALPAGLSFSSSTGVVSGTPNVLSPATTYTVTVTDTNGATATATFSLTINSAISTSTSVASTVLTQGHAASVFTPVTATGGTGTLTYSVSPALPAGLLFSSLTGAVSGTSTALAAATTYTVTATDTNGATATATFSLTVNSAVSTSTSIASIALTQGHAAAAFTPVTASGGTGALSYSVSPALPAGLLFSSTTGTVSGTATAVSAAATYTVTATDTNGATATATFSLTINTAVSTSTSVASTVLAPGVAASAFTPVTASGGTGALTYSVAPALPAGLVFSSTTGAVSGTPASPSAAATYTVTVTDTNGATATAPFSLTVNSAILTSTAVASSTPTPTYGSPVVLTATITPAPADTPPGMASFYSGLTLLGTVPLNTAGVATLSISLPLGPNSITAVYSGSARYAGSTSSALSISNRSVTSITFSGSPTTQLYNNPIVLTAQATSSTAGTLTGTINFLDGATVIATVPLGSNGQATYSITTLGDGSHSLTAAYAGDDNFLPSPSTGAAVAITVGDVNLNLGGDQNQAVIPGAAVSYNFPLSPLVTPTFLYDVHLTATGLPPGATYTFSPALIPAGSASQPVTLTVKTSKGIALLSHPTDPGQNSSRALTALAFGLLLPLLGAKQVRKRLQALPKTLTMLLCTILSLGAVVGLSGCGSGGFYGATATSGKYTITVTATSADLVRTSTVQLTIQ